MPHMSVKLYMLNCQPNAPTISKNQVIWVNNKRMRAKKASWSLNSTPPYFQNFHCGFRYHWATLYNISKISRGDTVHLPTLTYQIFSSDIPLLCHRPCEHVHLFIPENDSIGNLIEMLWFVLCIFLVKNMDMNCHWLTLFLLTFVQLCLELQNTEIGFNHQQHPPTNMERNEF